MMTKEINAETLTERLNNAAKKAGEPTGYVVRQYADQTDPYADYVGYAVEGPDQERALNWICKAVWSSAKRTPEVYTHRSNGYKEGKKHVVETKYVCTARYSLGD